jgi:hypothetical protein
MVPVTRRSHPRSRSRARRPDRVPRRARLAPLAGVVACSFLPAAPSPAGADVARLEPIARIVPGEPPPTDHQVVVTDQRGVRRTLGPVPAGTLHAAPDGRHLVVIAADDEPASPTLVPLDGSPVRPLQLPVGTAVVDSFSRTSWTFDGAELLIGDALAWDPSAFASLEAIDDLDRLRWTALRCPVVTGVCTELPRPNGFAVGVPDGILTTSSFLSSYPPSWIFGGLGGERPPTWERPTSPRGRTLTGIVDGVRTSSTQLVGPPTATLGRARRTGSAGLPVAVSAVGGPAGAVISRITFTTTLERRRGRIRLKMQIRSPRFLLARPGAPLRAFASPPVSLSRQDRRRIDRSTATPGRRLHFFPLFGTADGWVGGAGTSALAADGTAVLATMHVDGRVRPVTVRGRPATAWALLRAVHGNSPGRVTDPIEVIGYEAAGNLIVTIYYQPPSKNSPGGSTTLRVPLRGSALPTIIRGRVDAAW